MSETDGFSADSPGAPGELPAGPVAAFDVHLGMEGGAEIEARAAAGHSPSIRLLVNASDDVVSIATSSSNDVPPTLRSRVMASLRTVAAGDPSRAARPLRPANEATGILHRTVAGEAARLARVAELPAELTAEGDEAPVDRALARVLGQLHPFFDFEMVIVSIVTAEHTVHRVSRGLPADGSYRVVPREVSFCTHTVSAGEPFVVEDGAREAFFRGSTVVQGLGVRAYIGVPVLSGDQIVGSLCALSRRRQDVSAYDVALMAQFARVVMGLFDGTRTAPSVYERSLTAALIAAQRDRVRARPTAMATTLFRAPSDWSFDRPEHVVIGEAEDGTGLVLLVPVSHSAHAALVELARSDPRVTAESLA